MGIDQLQHGDLLALHGGDSDGRCMAIAARALVRQTRERLTNGLMRDVTLSRLLNQIEPAPPLRINGFRIFEVLLVELFDERRVAAEEVRGPEKLFHQCGHVRNPRRCITDNRSLGEVCEARFKSGSASGLRISAAWRPVRHRAWLRRYRAAAAVRSSARDQRSSRSTARSSRRYAQGRRSP